MTHNKRLIISDKTEQLKHVINKSYVNAVSFKISYYTIFTL